MPTFAERVRELRLQQNMNQKQLADELNVSKSRIAMYEQDKRKPDFQFLELMADYFNVDVDYLMGKTDIPNRYQEELKSTKTSSVESSNSSICFLFTNAFLQKIRRCFLPLLNVWRKAAEANL